MDKKSNKLTTWLTTFGQALKTISQRKLYWIVAICSALAIVVLAIVVSNLGAFTFTWTAPFFDLGDRIKATPPLFALFFTTMHWESQLLTYLVAALSGLNVALMVYYFKERFSFQRAAGVGLFGLLTGVFGVGCSACGSVLLSTVFGAGATAGLLGFLPFQGLEISMLSIVLLLASTYYLAKKIQEPMVCAPSYVKKPTEPEVEK